MDEKQSAALRAPFPDTLISQLPKLSCYQCGQQREKVCDRHRKEKCRDCGAWISTGHIHLSYVGHAETTDRFLDVDPGWSWEPMAFDSDGLPKLDGNGGLWMRLTIAGVTRPCYGDSQGKTGPNAVKEAIGDGLRNGGMRFGVALDLWAKSDLASIHADKETGEIAPPAQQRSAGRSEAPAPRPAQSAAPAAPALSDEKAEEINRAKRRVRTLGGQLSMDDNALVAEFAGQFDGAVLRDAGLLQLQSFGDYLEHLARTSNGSVPA